MLSEELLRKMNEDEEKARKWDKMSGRYVEVGELIKSAIGELDSAHDRFAKALELIDPMMAVKRRIVRKRFDSASIIQAQYQKLLEGKQVTVESMMADHPDIPRHNLTGWLSTKLSKMDGVSRVKNGHKVVLFIEKKGD